MEHWEAQMNNVVEEAFEFGRDLMNSIIASDLAETKPGSLKYLLFGTETSKQSFVIRVGKSFEKFFEFLLEKGVTSPTSLASGVHKETKKDRDLLAIYEADKIVYYRELKANIELDTEKLPATIEKIKRITEHLEREYPGYKINAGCLCWSTYDSLDLANKFNSKIKKFQEANVTLDFAEEFFKFVNAPMTKEQYYDYFKSLGEMFDE